MNINRSASVVGHRPKRFLLNFLSILEFLLYIFSFARSCPSSFSITILNYLLEVWTVNPFGWRSISVGSKHFNLLLYIYIYIYIDQLQRSLEPTAHLCPQRGSLMGFTVQAAHLCPQRGSLMDSQSKPRRNVINYREFGRKTTGNQGDVGSNPAQGIKSFSSNENVIQRVVRPWSLLNSLSLSIYIYIYIYI